MGKRIQRVQTQAGVKKYGVPIGTIITADVRKAAKVVRGKPSEPAAKGTPNIGPVGKPPGTKAVLPPNVLSGAKKPRAVPAHKKQATYKKFEVGKAVTIRRGATEWNVSAVNPQRVTLTRMGKGGKTYERSFTRKAMEDLTPVGSKETTPEVEKPQAKTATKPKVEPKAVPKKEPEPEVAPEPKAATPEKRPEPETFDSRPPLDRLKARGDDVGQGEIPPELGRKYKIGKKTKVGDHRGQVLDADAGGIVVGDPDDPRSEKVFSWKELQDGVDAGKSPERKQNEKAHPVGADRTYGNSTLKVESVGDDYVALTDSEQGRQVIAPPESLREPVDAKKVAPEEQKIAQESLPKTPAPTPEPQNKVTPDTAEIGDEVSVPGTEGKHTISYVDPDLGVQVATEEGDQPPHMQWKSWDRASEMEYAEPKHSAPEPPELEPEPEIEEPEPDSLVTHPKDIAVGSEVQTSTHSEGDTSKVMDKDHESITVQHKDGALETFDLSKISADAQDDKPNTITKAGASNVSPAGDPPEPTTPKPAAPEAEPEKAEPKKAVDANGDEFDLNSTYYSGKSKDQSYQIMSVDEENGKAVIRSVEVGKQRTVKLEHLRRVDDPDRARTITKSMQAPKTVDDMPDLGKLLDDKDISDEQLTEHAKNLEGQYGGLGLTDTKMFRTSEGLIVMEGYLHDEDGLVGRVKNNYSRNEQGELEVDVDLVEIAVDRAKGKGFNSNYQNAMDTWYRRSGVKRKTLYASLEDGGYTWAKAGYTWDKNKSANNNVKVGSILERLEARLDRMPSEADKKKLRALISKFRDQKTGDLHPQNHWPPPHALATFTDSQKKSWGRDFLGDQHWYGSQSMNEIGWKDTE